MVMKTPFFRCGYLNCRRSALFFASNWHERHFKRQSYNPRQTKVVGKVVQLNLVHFNPQKKRVFSFAKYPRTITRTNVKLFLDFGPGAGEGRKGKKKRSKVAA